MKTSTMLLLGGAAVVGYLYATRKAQALISGPATSGLAAQAMTAQPAIIADQVTVNVEDDDYGGYGPGWGVYGVPIFGFGGRRHRHHGHHHGGGGGGGGGHRYRGGGGGRSGGRGRGAR